MRARWGCRTHANPWRVAATGQHAANPPPCAPSSRNNRLPPSLPTLKAANIVIAVGGTPHKLAIPGAEHCITSDEALELPSCPKKVRPPLRRGARGSRRPRHPFAGGETPLGCASWAPLDRSLTLDR